MKMFMMLVIQMAPPDNSLSLDSTKNKQNFDEKYEFILKYSHRYS